jgi:hypothetical protein
VHVAQVQLRNRHSGFTQRDGVAHIAQQDQRAGRLRALASWTEQPGRRLHAQHLEVDAWRDRQRHRGARQDVPGRFVVGHQDAVRVERREPGLQDLAVHETVVDAHQRHAWRLDQPILRIESLR